MAKAPAKKAAAKKATKKVTKKPAKKAAGGASKSEAIRQFFKANPKATGKEVVDGLKKKGINVSVGLVGNVKAKAGLSKKRKRRKAAPAAGGAAKAVAAQTVSVSALKEAKKLIGEAGSPSAAIEAIKILDGLS